MDLTQAQKRKRTMDLKKAEKNKIQENKISEKTNIPSQENT